MFGLGKRVGTMLADYTVGLVIVMTHLTIADAEQDRALPLDEPLDRPSDGQDSQRANRARGD